jgi:hypothetical protein
VPYSDPLVERFAEKLAAELSGGAVDQAIMLTNNCTDTGWFHSPAGPAALLCFTRGRVNFDGPDDIGGPCRAKHSSTSETDRRSFVAITFVIHGNGVLDYTGLA